MQVARLLFTSPTQAFTALKEKPVFALPMVLMILGLTLVTVAYYAKVDIAWFLDQMMASARNVNAQQQQVMASIMTRKVLLASSAISAPIGLSVAMVISALYLLIAGNITKVRYSFKHWFAFSWWGSSPLLIGNIAALLTIAFSRSTQISQSAMQPLSLNELVFHKTLGQPGFTLLTSLGLIQIASLWLTYVGIKAWSGRSTTFALVFVLVPYVLIYGVWAFFAFR